MPHFVTPNSFGAFIERNPCHDPKDGRFAPKGRGNCAPLTDLQSDVGGRTFLTRTVRDRIKKLVDDPKFNIDSALKMAGPEFRQRYLSMMEKAPAAHAEMTRNLDRAMSRLGARNVPYEHITEGSGIRASMGNIKGARRLIEKTVTDNFGDLSEMRDVVRSSIAVDAPHQVEAVFREVKRNFKIVGEPKDRFKNPVDGYRDMMIRVRLSNGLVGEIQIHAKPILKIKEGEGHRLYTQLRSAPKSASKRMATQISNRMVALYSSAWAAFIAVTATSAATAGRRFM